MFTTTKTRCLVLLCLSASKLAMAQPDAPAELPDWGFDDPAPADEGDTPQEPGTGLDDPEPEGETSGEPTDETQDEPTDETQEEEPADETYEEPAEPDISEVPQEDPNYREFECKNLLDIGTFAQLSMQTGHTWSTPILFLDQDVLKL